jgi:hypothetical protein
MPKYFEGLQFLFRSELVCFTRSFHGHLWSDHKYVWYLLESNSWRCVVSLLLLHKLPSFCPPTCHGSAQECSCQNGFLLGLPDIQDTSFPRPRDLPSTGGGGRSKTPEQLTPFSLFPIRSTQNGWVQRVRWYTAQPGRCHCCISPLYS